MEQWLTGLTAQVAANLEHHRRVRGLTRAELARRATAAGLPTRRPALAGLLDGARQTVTLQELVVFAQVLEVTVAELIVPLHNGAAVIIDDGGPVHAYTAAERLLGIPRSGRLDQSTTYRPFARYLAAADRFTAANARLLSLSRRLAAGTATANSADGRPHPASEILATEAAASRLLTARADLDAAGIAPPPTDVVWSFVELGTPLDRLPVIEHAPGDAYPLFVYRLTTGTLPTAELLPEPAAST